MSAAAVLGAGAGAGGGLVALPAAAGPLALAVLRVSELLPAEGWVILTGFLAAASCGLLGCYLVLRRLSMLGDAISHAALPGIVIAFLLTSSRTSLPMLAGAAALGVLTTFLIEALEKTRRVHQDAAIGTTFTTLFAIGVLLVVLAAGNVDLDQECVLYGELELVTLDLVPLGSQPPAVPGPGAGSAGADLMSLAAGARAGDLGPRATVVLAAVFALVLAFVALLWKELLVCSFDPQLAASMGIRVGLIHYLLMGMVSVTVVAAFESVGVILVVAMLIAPAATAQLCTDRLPAMMGMVLVVAAVSAVGGHQLAGALAGASTAGGMATVAGLCFAAAWLLAPRHGLLARWAAHAMVRLQVARENLAGELLRAEQHGALGAGPGRAGAPLRVVGALRAAGSAQRAPARPRAPNRRGHARADRPRARARRRGARGAPALAAAARAARLRPRARAPGSASAGAPGAARSVRPGGRGGGAGGPVRLPRRRCCRRAHARGIVRARPPAAARARRRRAGP
ncbi:MAG: hypothetical protein KatS3mg102_2394 [Planctomycetota bacterium]|nr:MAG: hypothetical protein KatS3mg102_2394 [Planctomycetota bacterium]